MKLDKKDSKILQELERNGRALIKTISNKTGIPRDSVNYRIKKMLKEGVIKGFVPVCDTTQMDYPVYTWLNLQLQHFDEKKEKQFVAFLKSTFNVVYIAKVTGKYHYMITIAAKTIQDLDQVLRSIMAKFPTLIKSYNTSLMIEEIQYDSFHRLIREESKKKK